MTLWERVANLGVILVSFFSGGISFTPAPGAARETSRFIASSGRAGDTTVEAANF